MTAETATVVLSCTHLKRVAAPVEIPDVTDCPLCDREREITGIFGEEETS
jgi:hypothetical protein